MPLLCKTPHGDSKGSLTETLVSQDSHVTSSKLQQDSCSGTMRPSDPESGPFDWSSHARNPLNWSRTRKYSIVVLLAVSAITASVSSTSFEPGVESILSDLGTTNESFSTLLVTAYLLGYIVGPLVVAPISEIYGRVAACWPAFVLLLASLAVSGASTNLGEFVFFRVILGLAANMFIIVGPGVVADMFPIEERGLALSIFSTGPLVGPGLGPMIGGIIVQSLSWRWVFWVALILAGVCTVLAGFIIRETYHPLLRGRLTGESTTVKSGGESLTPSNRDWKQVIRRSFQRPFRLLFTTAIVPLLGFYTSFSYAVLNISLATLGTIYETRYGFSTALSGVVYVGLTIGFIVCIVSVSLFADRYVVAMKKRYGDYKPERRLPPAVFGSAILPVALFLYGWAIEKDVCWVVPLIASGMISASAVYSFLGAQMYLVDTYTVYASSATGIVSMTRAIGATVIPLAAIPSYDKFGYGWGNSIFGFIAIAFIPLAVFIQVKGEKLRTSLRFQPKLS